MPYAIKRSGSKYHVVNTDTGHSFGLTTRGKATKQLSLLKRIESNYTDNGDGTFTGKLKGRPVRIKVK